MTTSGKNWLAVERLEIDEILAVLPHRYPFLMVDRVLEVRTTRPLNLKMSSDEIKDARKGSFARTLKNVTFNEGQFLGHFPEKPIFPGVLTLETMAQAAAFVALPFLTALNQGKFPRMEVALAGFDDVRFRRPIRPGDQMMTKVVAENIRGNIWSFQGEVMVDSKPAAEGRFLAQVQDRGGSDEHA